MPAYSFSEAVSLPDCSSSDGWRKTAYALKWHEIRSFREADINGQPFIAVITSEPQKPAAQRHNRLRLWLRRLDERLTGSAINISPSSIHCRRDELYETLCEYLEKYGR